MSELAHAYCEAIRTHAGILRRVKLTPRENECVALIAGGRGYRQAAHDLGITARTVRFHISTAKRKVGARSCEHLVGLWIMAQIEGPTAS